MADTPEITVNGYSDRYVAAVALVLDREGGFVDDPRDRGGTTNWGISLRFLKGEGAFDADGDGIADFDLDFDGDIDGHDIRKLTRADAVWLYHESFWLPLGAARFARPLGEAMFDQAVNGGLKAARKLLQEALNVCYRINPPNGLPPLAVDGQVGPSTRCAYDAVLQFPALGMPALIREYRAAAATRYRAIVARHPSQARFLNGWLRRAEHLGRP